MDIINYTEVDALEEHLLNRAIQEALLDENTCEWALNFDKKNLGKNFAIAFGLPVSEWEQYKNLHDLENMTGNPSGGGNAFVILGRLSLSLSERFYDKILPHAKAYNGTVGSVGYRQHIQSGTTTLLKVRMRTHGDHDAYTFETRIAGNYGDTNIQDVSGNVFERKIVNKYNELTMVYSKGWNCATGYTYTVWYI